MRTGEWPDGSATSKKVQVTITNGKRNGLPGKFHPSQLRATCPTRWPDETTYSSNRDGHVCVTMQFPVSPSRQHRVPADPQSSMPAQPRAANGGSRPLLMVLGSAAVLSVYAVGYTKTQAAADAMNAKSAARSASRKRPTTPVAPLGQDDVAGKPITVAGVGTSANLPAMPTGQVATASSLPVASRVQLARTFDAVASPAAGTAAPPATTAATLSVTPPTAVATTPGASSPVAAVAPPPTQPSPAPPPPTSLAPAPAAVPSTTAAPPAPATADTLPYPTKWRDGTFSGWGTSRHGDIEATIIVEKGKITTAAISRCLTRYSCSWIAHLQPQVTQRQSPEIDNVSGATESANAFYYALVEALKSAR